MVSSPRASAGAAQQLLLEIDQLPPSKARSMDRVVDGAAEFQSAAPGIIRGHRSCARGGRSLRCNVLQPGAKNARDRHSLRLGATHHDTVLMVLGQAARMATAGVTVGLAASFGIMRLLRTELFGVTPSDPLTFSAAAFVLLAIALAAAWVPTLRAVRVGPLVALRHE